VVQTLQPDHYSIVSAAAHDYEAFYHRELEFRRELGFPPFAYLANLRATGPDQEEIRDFLIQARDRGRGLAEGEHVSLLGPAPNAIVKVKNRYRWNLLIKSPDRPRLHAFLRVWRAGFRTSSRLNWRLDIDPISFF
jgi:primosomal protein N' (replication factor Y)